jgi:hypothetical protein
MLTASPTSAATSSSTGAKALQGPHQGAQKSTTTVFPASAVALANVSLFRLVISDIFLSLVVFELKKEKSRVLQEKQYG